MSDELAAAVTKLLKQAPQDWTESPRDLSQCEQDALAALTAAGFIERRIVFSVRLPGQEQTHRIIIELTGEYGLVEAMEAAAQDWWARWKQQWEDLKRETGEPIRPAVTRESDFWRLSAEGKLAQNDLAEGGTAPIDFTLRRGFFDGRPRLLPDGRITRREPVRGHGRLVGIENATTGPLAVSVANASELAAVFAAAFEKVLKPAAGGLRPPEQPQSKNAAQSHSEPEFVFRRDGDGWFIKAFGEQGYLGHLVGFERLARLVHAAGQPVPMTELASGRVPKNHVSSAEAAAAGLSTEPPSAAPLVDEKGIEDINRKISECQQGIKEAEECGDATLAEVYRKEEAYWLEQKRAATLPGGKPRSFPTEIDRLRPMIHDSLARAYEKLRAAGLKQTANHFEMSIRAEGGYFIYSPCPPIPWQ